MKFGASWVAAVERMAREDLEIGRVACAEVLIGNREGVKLHRQFSGEGGKKTVRPDSLFRMASMTKPVVGVCFLIQYERGLIGLDDPVSRYIPELGNLTVGEFDSRWNVTGSHPSPREVTPRDLLTHSSGVGSGMWYYTKCDKAAIAEGMTLADKMADYGQMYLEFDPGTGASYSALAGFDILARLTEITSGMSIERFARENLFDPLGMSDSTFDPTPEQMGRIVTMHAERNGQAVPDEGSVEGRTFGGLPRTYFSGGAGLVSCGKDYARFAQMLLCEGQLPGGARILQPETVREMASPQLDPKKTWGVDDTWSWGLSVRVVTKDNGSQKPLNHGAFGWSGAYGTHFWVDPVNGLFAVYLSNMTTAGGSGALTARRIEAVVMEQIEGERE